MPNQAGNDNHKMAAAKAIIAVSVQMGGRKQTLSYCRWFRQIRFDLHRYSSKMVSSVKVTLDWYHVAWHSGGIEALYLKVAWWWDLTRQGDGSVEGGPAPKYYYNNNNICKNENRECNTFIQIFTPGKSSASFFFFLKKGPLWMAE